MDTYFAYRKEENPDCAAVCFWVELRARQAAPAQKNIMEKPKIHFGFPDKSKPVGVGWVQKPIAGIHECIRCHMAQHLLQGRGLIGSLTRDICSVWYHLLLDSFITAPPFLGDWEHWTSHHHNHWGGKKCKMISLRSTIKPHSLHENLHTRGRRLEPWTQS